MGAETEQAGAEREQLEAAAARTAAPAQAPARGTGRAAALLRQATAPRAGVPNRRLARDLQGGTVFLPGPGAPSQVPAPPQRGVNPADGIAAITRRLLRTRPGNEAGMRRAATRWAAAVVAAIRAAAASSGASHSQAIVDNEADEINRAVTQILDDYFGPSASGSGRLRNCHEALLALAERKEQEVRLQFHHNVIVETDEWGNFGSPGGDDLTMLGTALTGMPDQHVWGAPDRPLRFRREFVAGGSLGTGGETDPPTSRITLYSSGMQSGAYDRSAALGIPGFMQTIRHEIGHTVEHRLTPADRAELFTSIMGWKRYSWAWITTRDSPYDTWRAERAALVAETGLEDAQLDPWLAGFVIRTARGALERSDTRTRGSRCYVRSRTQGDRLHSIKSSETPQGAEFDYALTEQNDYLAELYMFAISRPFWLASKISRAQKAWWRQKVFGTPGSDADIMRVAGMAPDAQMRFMRLVGGLFTWQQISDAIAAAAVADNVA